MRDRGSDAHTTGRDLRHGVQDGRGDVVVFPIDLATTDIVVRADRRDHGTHTVRRAGIAELARVIRRAVALRSTSWCT